MTCEAVHKAKPWSSDSLTDLELCIVVPWRSQKTMGKEISNGLFNQASLGFSDLVTGLSVTSI